MTTGGVTYDIMDAVAREAVENDCITLSATLTAFPRTITNTAITADMAVISATFGSPQNLDSDVTWTTSSGKIVLRGTLSGSTTATLILAKTESV